MFLCFGLHHTPPRSTLYIWERQLMYLHLFVFEVTYNSAPAIKHCLYIYKVTKSMVVCYTVMSKGRIFCLFDVPHIAISNPFQFQGLIQISNDVMSPYYQYCSSCNTEACIFVSISKYIYYMAIFYCHNYLSPLENIFSWHATLVCKKTSTGLYNSSPQRI